MNECIDWDDPAARGALIHRVGPVEYNRLIEDYHKRSVVATVNGYTIRPVGSRFGRLFMVDGTNTAFSTQAEAETFAAKQPAREVQQ